MGIGLSVHEAILQRARVQGCAQEGRLSGPIFDRRVEERIDFVPEAL
jgi:hypothetical protein